MTAVSLDKTTAPTGAEPTQVQLLSALLLDLAKSAGTAEPKVFSSGNTGVYASVRLKAPDARALGIEVPIGGKLTLSVQAVVVNPANSKDA